MAHRTAPPERHLLYRQGVTSPDLANETDPARKALHRATDLGPEAIRQRSSEVLKQLDSKGQIPLTSSRDR